MPSITPPPTVLVFLKPPRPGIAKTRLTRDLGANEAMRIYRQLVERQMAALPREWHRQIHFAPADAEHEMHAWLGSGPTFHAQVEGDLGQRLAHAFRTAFAGGATCVIAIGGDCPDLDETVLRRAAASLAHVDVVIGPATDGGYYLIGLRRLNAAVFERIPWSTSEVCATTLARVAEAGLGCAVLPELADIDDADDWRRHREGRAARRLAIVIPALNEADRIQKCVTVAKGLFRDGAVIVVDGGSTDATREIAAQAGARVVGSARGRGLQCRAGAAAAMDAEWLLFLHADTVLPDNADEIVARFTAVRDSRIATFKLRFDEAGWFLRACAWFTRFDTVFTRFGDQGILLRRSFYEQLGGFPEWPLFEDVWLLQQARRRTRVYSLPGAVTTSARRFTSGGAMRQQWRNARLLFRYLRGDSPFALARSYERPRAGLPAAEATPVGGSSDGA